MADDLTTSLSLLGRAQARQEEAWARLVELYGPLVHHWLRRCGLTGEDAADAFQEVFRSLARSLDAFHRDRGGDSFRGWLRTITRNKARDHFRRARPLASGGSEAQRALEALPDEAAVEPDPVEEGLVQQQVRVVLAALEGEFEPRTWRAFWEVQMEGRGPAEVAAELGMTPAAARKAKYRVFRRLREELAGLID